MLSKREKLYYAFFFYEGPYNPWDHEKMLYMEDLKLYLKIKWKLKLKCIALWPILSEKDSATKDDIINMAHFYHVPDSVQFDPEHPHSKWARHIEEWTTPSSPRQSDSDEYYHYEVPEGEEEEYYEWKCKVEAYKEEKLYQDHLIL